MLLDRFAPRYDFTAIEHLVVDASPGATYEAVRHLDLLTVNSRLTDAAFWLRGLPERLRRRVPRRKPASLTLDDIDAGGDAVLLGEDPGREVVFGAVGRFWTPVVRWHEISADEFAGFDQPGLGKIAMAYSVRPYGAQRTLLSHETRVILDDPMARRGFGSVWATVAPLFRAVMRATLRAAKRSAESAPR
jgi:hypothetical protein